MADQTDRLRVIIELDGTASLSDGTKLSAEQVRNLGKELSQTGTQAESTGIKSEQAGRRIGAMGREIAQGDWRGAAVQMGRLAMETGTATGGFGLMGTVIGGATVALVAFGAAAYQAQKETERQANALLLTGNYAGLVSGQLNEMARSVATGINASVGGARSTLEGLVASGRVSAQSLNEMAQAVELVTQFSGRSRDSVVKDFASMSEGVAKWAAEHNKSYHFLTFEQYKYIEGLEKAGRQQEAMRVTSEALSQHLGGDLTRNLGTLQRAWKSVGDLASRAWDAMMNIGREDSLTDRLNKAREVVQAARYELEQAQRLAPSTVGHRQDILNQAQQRLAGLEYGAYGESRAASDRAARERAAEAAIAADRETKPPQNRVDPEIEAQRRLLAELAGLSPGFQEEWDRRTALYKTNQISLEQLIKSQADLLAKQPLMREAAKAEAEAQREVTKNREAAHAAATREYEAQEREIQGLLRGNEALELQINSVGKTKGEIEQLKAERLDHAIAMRQEQLATVALFDASSPRLEQIQREIEALRQQRELTRRLGQVEVADEQRRKNEADSKKFSEDLRRDMTDSLTRAFESGKNPAEALASTLATTIQTRVTRALAEAIANPFLKPLEGALSGLTGSGGLFGGLFGPSISGGTGLGNFSADDPLWNLLGGQHSGGLVGAEATFMRSVNMQAWAGAARLHTGGLVGGEVPIIAKRGEGVFTEGQMKSLAPVGSMAPQITVNVVPTAGQTATVTQRQTSDGTTIDVLLRQVEEAMADNVANGSGSLARSMEGRYGLRTAVA